MLWNSPEIISVKGLPLLQRKIQNFLGY